MGSSFFQSGFGKSFGKIAAQNPMNKLPSVFRGAGNILAPGILGKDDLDPMAKAANKYNQGQIVAGPGPTPFAGKQPTLQDANAGYLLAAKKIAQAPQQQQPGVQVPQTPPRAWMG